MAVEQTRSAGQPARGGVDVFTESTGSDRYEIVATATFESPPDEVWLLLADWERFVAVGLPGLTDNFIWLDGGPGRVPSTFKFDMAGATLVEEIYELTAEEEAGRYRLRYRTLEPALGVLEYDAVLELRRLPEARTAYSATRKVRLAPGTAPEMLADLVKSETQCLEDYFAP